MARSAWSNKVAGIGILGGRTLFIIISIIIIIAAAQRFDLRLDWSANRHFTLDPVLIKMINDVDQPTRIIAIWPKTSTQEQGQRLAAIGALIEPQLKAMARQSAQISWTHVDNEIDLPLLESLRTTYDGISGTGLYLVHSEQENRRPFRIPLTATLPTVLQRELGGALQNLQNDQQPTVLMIQGHGELRPGGGMENGASTLVRNWELAGFTVAPFDQKALSQLGRLPAEAVVVLAGPTVPLGDTMLQAIATHLRDGGPLLLMADHRISEPLSNLLRQRGIFIGPYHEASYITKPLPSLEKATLQPAHLLYSEQHSSGRDGSFHRLILRPELSFFTDSFDIMASTRNEGRLINSTASVPVSVADPRFWPDQQAAITAALEKNNCPNFEASPLLVLPSSESWVGPLAARQNPPRTLTDQGQVSIAWAIEYTAASQSTTSSKGARIVVWGSRQAASDGILAGESYANGQVLSDILGWLSNRGEQVRIPKASFTPFRVDAEKSTMNWLLAFLVAVIPCCLLGVAMIAWWERR